MFTNQEREDLLRALVRSEMRCEKFLDIEKDEEKRVKLKDEVERINTLYHKISRM